MTGLVQIKLPTSVVPLTAANTLPRSSMTCCRASGSGRRDRGYETVFLTHVYSVTLLNMILFTCKLIDTVKNHINQLWINVWQKAEADFLAFKLHIS